MKLYGWTWNPLIWLSIIIHDWGYWGKRDMDGDVPVLGGSWHPAFAATWLGYFGFNKTARFCLFHSRSMVKLCTFENWNLPVISTLGVADKLAIVYTPTWMYCREEMDEYITHENNLDINSLVGRQDRVKLWKETVNDKCLKFVDEWRDKAYALHQY